jgi:uncharacterized protein YjaG (DUF416 family)
MKVNILIKLEKKEGKTCATMIVVGSGIPKHPLFVSEKSEEEKEIYEILNAIFNVLISKAAAVNIPP